MFEYFSPTLPTPIALPAAQSHFSLLPLASRSLHLAMGITRFTNCSLALPDGSVGEPLPTLPFPLSDTHSRTASPL